LVVAGRFAVRIFTDALAEKRRMPEGCASCISDGFQGISGAGRTGTDSKRF